MDFSFRLVRGYNRKDILKTSSTLSEVIEMYIDKSYDNFLMIEIFEKGIYQANYGFHGDCNTTDETIIKATICDLIFG